MFFFLIIALNIYHHCLNSYRLFMKYFRDFVLNFANYGSVMISKLINFQSVYLSWFGCVNVGKCLVFTFKILTFFSCFSYCWMKKNMVKTTERRQKIKQREKWCDEKWSYKSLYRTYLLRKVRVCIYINGFLYVFYV